MFIKLKNQLLSMKKPLIFIVTLLILIYLSFLTIKPLFTAILSSFILAFVFYPFYAKLKSKIESKDLCALLTILVILLLIIIPTVFITDALAKESVTLYNKIKGDGFDLTPVLSKYFKSDSQQYIDSIIDGSILYIVKLTSNFILLIPNIALSFFVTIFLTYYLLKESSLFIDAAKKYMPFKEIVKEQILERFSKITKAIVFGTVLTAIIQGILGAIGFAIFSIHSPILWGFIMAAVSIIPLLGTSIVWFPAGIIQLAQQNYFSGLGILLFGALVIGTVDNFIKPKLVGKRANVHPAIILIGILGGLKLLGFIGLIIGPLILATAAELIKIETKTKPA